MLLIGACASLAGIEAPDPGSASIASSEPNAGDDAASVSEARDSGNDSETSATDGAPYADASDDADGATEPLPTECQPPKKANNATCAAPSECCSGACSAVGRCRDDCHEDEGHACNPFADSCCIGLYCLGAFPISRCKKCHKAGEKPAIYEEKACCSRMLDGNGMCL